MARTPALLLPVLLLACGCASDEPRRSTEPAPPRSEISEPAASEPGAAEREAPARAAAPAQPTVLTLPGAQPEHAPRPYTAEEIREGNPPGSERVYLWSAAGRPTVQSTFAFHETDGETVRMTSHEATEDGEPLDEPGEQAATWTSLRDHATFPAAKTTRERTTVEVPAGEFDAWLYTVTGRQPDTVERYWFALEVPGAPVLKETHVGDERVERMELVELRRP